MRPVIAVSLGCPSGIGPEVALAAAARAPEAAVVLVGDRWFVERAAKLAGVSKRRLVALHDRSSIDRDVSKGTIGYWSAAAHLSPADARFGRPTPGTGRAQLAWIDQATD